MSADPGILAELETSILAPKPAPHGGIQKVSYSHDFMIDLIIADPCITQDRLAKHFGYTPGWISQIIASDAFQARLAERKDELVDPTIRATIDDHFKALVTRSLAILREKLDKPAAEVPPNLALKALEIGSKALGYGARPDTPVPHITGEERLNQLANRLTPLLAQKRAEGRTIEATDVEVIKDA